MTEPDPGARVGEHIPAREASRRGLRGMRFPKLFVLVLLLFLVDLVLPDVVPFVDEIILGALAVMLGMLRERVRGPPAPPED